MKRRNTREQAAELAAFNAAYDRNRRRRSMNRPSFGRALAVRGLDQFDTPPVALDPLFAGTAAGGRARRIAAVPDGFLYRRKHTPGGSGQHCKGRRFPAAHYAPPS